VKKGKEEGRRRVAWDEVNIRYVDPGSRSQPREKVKEKKEVQAKRREGKKRSTEGKGKRGKMKGDL